MSTITFSNQSDTGISFLTHRNISINIMSKTIGVLELDPAIDTEPSAFYVAFYNRVARTLNESLELNGTFTVSYDIPEDWGELASDMIGATPTTNGSRGMVPQPLAGDEDKVLKGDGTWGQVAVPVEVGDMTGATATKNGSHGLAPQPLKGDEEKFLKGDGTWGNVVTADMTGATVSEAGSHGLVPAPAAGAQERFLRGDGTWAEASTLNFIDGAVYDVPEKSNGFVILSTDSVNLNSTITSIEVTIVNSSGDVTVSSSNTNIVTVSEVLNNKFTVVGQSNGDALINISVPASADFKAYTTSIPVNVHFKAAGQVSLSSNSVSLGFNQLTSTVTVINATGALSVESSDSSVVTAVLSGNTITLNSVNNTTGSVTITVNVASTDDYLATSASIAVNANFEKTAGSVSLSTTDVTLDSETTSTTVTVLSSTGTVSVSSSDTSIATASISGDIITINSVNDTTGTATITVSVAESTEYLATSAEISVVASFMPLESLALKFSSDDVFHLSATKKWDGTLEYSIDEGSTWTTWTGSNLKGTVSQPIYLRGIGNTVITGEGSTTWSFTGKYVTGNIETLLDYQTVKQGNHPTMGAYCFNDMFDSCNSITITPEFPATTLSESCYRNMFNNCVRLQSVPLLPATTLTPHCYRNMFRLCVQLTVLPSLPAQILSDGCYLQMFSGCANIKLSPTKTGDYQYDYRIPTMGSGKTAEMAVYNMFSGTGGTFTGEPVINTTYYTDHEPVSPKVNLTFNANGGTGTMSNASVSLNSTYEKLNICGYEYENKYFVGWNTLSDGTGTYYTNETLITSDLTLYAIWGTCPTLTLTGSPSEISTVKVIDYAHEDTEQIGPDTYVTHPRTLIYDGTTPNINVYPGGMVALTISSSTYLNKLAYVGVDGHSEQPHSFKSPNVFSIKTLPKNISGSANFKVSPVTVGSSTLLTVFYNEESSGWICTEDCYPEGV